MPHKRPAPSYIDTPTGRRALPPQWTVPAVTPGLYCAEPRDQAHVFVLMAWNDDLVAVAKLCDGSVHGDVAISSATRAVEILDTASVQPDVLFVCGSVAWRIIDAFEKEKGLMERWRAFPVVCDPDQFVRGASLDRDAAGRPVWYKPPVDFVPSARSMSDEFVRASVELLVAHRCKWIHDTNILRTMHSISFLARMPLHMAARPQQTQIADALIDRIWMENCETLPPPVLNVVDQFGERPGKFRGASVLDAVLGLHRCPVAMPDVRSLYPSVVREWLADEYPLMAKLFSEMIQKRRDTSDRVQNHSLKVITNAVFGSRKYGRFRCVELSERIAELGRRVQHESVQRLNEMEGVTIVGGDTDSLALAVDERLPLDATLVNIVRVLNRGRTHVLYNTTVDVYQPFFFVSNKSWAGIDRQSGAIVTRGLMQNRSVAPRFVLPAHEKWIRRVLTDVTFRDQAIRAQWIEDTARRLETTSHRLDSLLVWPKPTHDHPDTDRAYFVVCGSQEHVPRRDYLDTSRSWPPVDVKYLVRVYFTDDVRRHHQHLAQ